MNPSPLPPVYRVILRLLLFWGICEALSLAWFGSTLGVICLCFVLSLLCPSLHLFVRHWMSNIARTVWILLTGFSLLALLPLAAFAFLLHSIQRGPYPAPTVVVYAWFTLAVLSRSLLLLALLSSFSWRVPSVPPSPGAPRPGRMPGEQTFMSRVDDAARPR